MGKPLWAVERSAFLISEKDTFSCRTTTGAAIVWVIGTRSKLFELAGVKGSHGTHFTSNRP